MVEYLDELSKHHRVVRFDVNMGPRHFATSPHILELLPEYFVLTDSDLVFNKNLPNTFIEDMKKVIDCCGVSKAGFALNMDETVHEFFNKDYVRSHEREFWNNQVPQTELSIPDKVYRAPIDTTFCLFKKSIYAQELNDANGSIIHTSAVRIADRFACEHMGWWLKQPVSDDELEYYKMTHNGWCSTLVDKIKLGYEK